MAAGLERNVSLTTNNPVFGTGDKENKKGVILEKMMKALLFQIYYLKSENFEQKNIILSEDIKEQGMAYIVED